MDRSRDVPLVSWSAHQCPFGVEYAPKVFDDIRLAAADAFFLTQRGGVEIGGILLGDFRKKRLRITAYAPLECEHAFGPSFMLSDRDRERLAALLVRGDPSGRRAVGWYHSHTRSEILLSDADREIHKRFFPEAWQTALVLKPHTFQPTRAGFFFPGADGWIQGETAYGEFVLDPLPPQAEDAGETPPRREARRKAPRRWLGILLAVVACLAAVFASYEAGEILGLQAALKAQTERAGRAEKSLADARSQLKAEQEKSAALAAAAADAAK